MPVKANSGTLLDYSVGVDMERVTSAPLNRFLPPSGRLR
jgi:hypothetical protein